MMTRVPPIADLVVAEARSWIGTPYQHQASLKGVGCDCLGLVRGVWRALYGEEPEHVPAYSRDWAEAEMTVIDPFGNGIRFGEIMDKNNLNA